MYEFVVRGYNYNCMVTYRDSVCSAAVVVACAAQQVARLEREASRPLFPVSAASERVMPLDWELMCTRLVASVRSL